jgi:hypothetical protein
VQIVQFERFRRLDFSCIHMDMSPACLDVQTCMAMGLAYGGKVKDARASNPRRPRLIHFLEIKCCESISHITASDAHKKSDLSTIECKTLYRTVGSTQARNAVVLVRFPTASPDSRVRACTIPSGFDLSSSPGALAPASITSSSLSVRLLGWLVR